MRSSYLSGKDATKHKDYSICKSFLNKWLNDSYLSLEDTCYYLDNYSEVEMRFGHTFAPPSFAFKFVLNKNKKELLDSKKASCYHGISVTLINKIVNEGLLPPNNNDVKERNGTYHGKAIYTTKIPEHAQVFADPYEWEGKYMQVFFLVRQDEHRVSWYGIVDSASDYAKKIYIKDTFNMMHIDVLHSRFVK